MTLTSILLLGFLLGMRHALEADHLAAMATLASASPSMTHTVRQGVAWGAGHTLVLVVFGGAVILLGRDIPSGTAQSLEAVVGCMLVLLGASTLHRLWRDRVHLHRHRHADGADHFHAHAHNLDDQGHDSGGHRHTHARWLPGRAIVVGMVHGLAGSAALVLLSVQAVQSWSAALAYILIFGVGSMLGMGLLSAAIAMPLCLSTRYLTSAHVLFTATIGSATVVLGVCMVYRISLGISGVHG